MTTIIIVIVAAWIFFTAAYVFLFIEWKDETSRRAEKLREMEAALKDMDSRLIALASSIETLGKMEAIRREVSDMNRFRHRQYEYDGENRERPSPARDMVMNISEGKDERAGEDGQDPFRWVREKEPKEAADTEEGVKADTVTNETPADSIKDIKEKAGAGNTYIEEEKEGAAVREETSEKAVKDPGPEEAAAEPEKTEEKSAEEARRPEEDVQEENDDNKGALLEMIEAPPENRSGQTEERDEKDHEIYDEIDLDFIDDDHEFSRIKNSMDTDRPRGRDVGRSGKKYTAEELEELIKE